MQIGAAHVRDTVDRAGTTPAVPIHTAGIRYSAAFCATTNLHIGTKIGATCVRDAAERASAVSAVHWVIRTMRMISCTTLVTIVCTDVG
jgi:hypothetical protein